MNDKAMIQIEDTIKVSYTKFINDVGKAVAKIIRADMMKSSNNNKLLTTKEAAELLGISADRMRHCKDKYSPIKKSGNKQGRLLFSRETLMKEL